MTEKEYVDLTKMMERTRLAEMDSTRDYYTWSNKHTKGIIYSRIDRVLSNLPRFQSQMNTTLQVLPPNVSDQCILYLANQNHVTRRKPKFKFINCVVSMEGYEAVVAHSYEALLTGRPMYVLWKN